MLGRQSVKHVEFDVGICKLRSNNCKVIWARLQIADLHILHVGGMHDAFIAPFLALKV